MKQHHWFSAHAGVLRRAALVAASTLFIATGAQAGPAAAVADREYAEALQSFRSGRTSEAFGRFVELANRGDPDAARVALFMHQYGSALYGKQWDAFPNDVAYWSSLVRNSGTSARASGEFLPTVLTPQKPVTKPAAKSAKVASIKNVAAP
jgi:hypothetical protein